MPNISPVTNYITKSAENFSTTIASPGTTTPGAVSVPLVSTSAYSQSDWVVLVVAPGTSSQGVFTGQVNGSNIINVQWTESGNGPYAAGTAVVDYVTATHWNLINTGFQKEHKNSGAHSAITADSLYVSGAINGSNGLSIGSGQVLLPNASNDHKSLKATVAFSVVCGETSNYPSGDSQGNQNNFKFDVKQYDIGNNFTYVPTGQGYDLNSYYFTAPLKGLYHFDSSMSSLGNSSRDMMAILKKNGTVFKRTNRSNTATADYRLISADLLLESGDKVSVALWSNNSFGIDTNTSNNYFNGHLVAAVA